MTSARLLLSACAVAALLSACASIQSASPDISAPVAERAARLGATDLVSAPGPDGGSILNGKLNGRAFVLATPAQWNRGAVFFAQGYATPGSTPVVPPDPITKDPGGGSLCGRHFGLRQGGGCNRKRRRQHITPARFREWTGFEPGLHPGRLDGRRRRPGRDRDAS